MRNKHQNGYYDCLWLYHSNTNTDQHTWNTRKEKSKRWFPGATEEQLLLDLQHNNTLPQSTK